MTPKKKLDVYNLRGFSLIELLIVIAMLSFVVVALYSLYSTHRQSAYTQDSVVEVQQNLRIGIDTMTRDIKMAGFGVPWYDPVTGARLYPIRVVTDNPLGTSDVLTINAASITGAVAKITQARTGPGAFIVDLAESVDRFQQNDLVTIVRPTKPVSLPAGLGPFQVNGVPDRVALTVPIGGVGATVEFMAGDIIVWGAQYPNRITYCLASATTPCNNILAPTCPANQLCLVKIVNGILAGVIAQNMTDLQFSYLLDNPLGAAPLEAPLNTAIPTAANYGTIHAVRVTLSGQTPPDGLGNVRQRQMVSIIEIRNRMLL